MLHNHSSTEDTTQHNKNWSLPEQDDEKSTPESKPLSDEETLVNELNHCLKTGNYIPKIIKVPSQINRNPRYPVYFDYYLHVLNFNGIQLTKKPLRLSVSLDSEDPIRIITTLPNYQFALYSHPDNSGTIWPSITHVPCLTLSPDGPICKAIAYSPNKDYLVCLDENLNYFVCNEKGTLTAKFNIPLIGKHASSGTADYEWGDNNIHFLNTDKILVISGNRAFTFDIDFSKNPPQQTNEKEIKSVAPLQSALHVNDFPNKIMAVVSQDKKLTILKVNGDYDSFTTLFQIKDFNSKIVPQQFNEFLFYFTKTNLLAKLNVNTLAVENIKQVETPSQLYINRQGYVVMDGSILNVCSPLTKAQFDRELATGAFEKLPIDLSQLVASYVNKPDDLYFPTSLLELKGSERLSPDLREKTNELLYRFVGLYYFEENKKAAMLGQILLFFSSRLQKPTKSIAQCVTETEKQFFATMDKELKELFKQIKLTMIPIKTHFLFTKKDKPVSQLTSEKSQYLFSKA